MRRRGSGPPGTSCTGLAKTLRFTTDSTRTVGQDAWYFLFQATGNTFRFLARNDQVNELVDHFVTGRER